VVLNDTGAILDVMGKLRAVYPNVLHVDRKAFLEVRQHGKLQADPRKLSDRDLFGDFFQEVTGSALTVDEASTYEAIVEEFRRRERETAPACDR
jgi:exonuclease SbcD